MTEANQSEEEVVLKKVKSGKITHLIQKNLKIWLLPSIKGAKYPLGKNPENLTPYQKNKLDEIKHLYPILFRGYQLKEGLRFVFQCGKENAEHELNKWLAWACRCRIPVFVELSKK